MTSKASRRKDILDTISNIKTQQRTNNGLNRQNFSGLASGDFGSVAGTSSGGSSSSNGYLAGDNLGSHIATQDLNLANFNVIGVNSIQFYTENQTITDDANGMRFSLPDTLDTYDFSIDGNQSISMGKFFLNLTNTRIQMLEEAAPSAPTSLNHYVYVDSTSHHLTVKHNGSTFDLEGAGGWVGTATSSLNMGNYNITGINQLAFTETGQTITDDTNGMRFSLPDAADTYDFTIDSNLNLSIQKYFIDFKNSRIQMTEEVAPSAPASTKNYVYVDSTSHHLTIRHPTGSAVDLELTTTGFPNPVTTNLDMDDNDILGVNLLDFDGTTTEIRGLTNLNFYHTDRQITSTSAYTGLLHTVASNEKHGFLVGGAARMEISTDVELSTDLDMKGNDIEDVDQIDFQVTGQRIDGAPTGLEYEVPSGDSHKFYVNSDLKITVASTGITFSDFALFNDTVQLNGSMTVQGGGDIHLTTGGRFDFVDTGTPTGAGGYVTVKVGGVTKYIPYYS